MNRLIPQYVMVLILALSLGACSTWFKKKGSDPIAGKRISIIVDSSDTEVDQSLDQEAIKLPAPYVNDYWLQPGGLAVHTPQHLQLAKEFKEIMRYSIGAGSTDEKRLRIQPIYIDNTIYSVDTNYIVRAYDVKNKKFLWQKPLTKGDNNGEFGGGISFAIGKLYITTGFAKLFALNIDTGEEVFTTDLAAPSRAAPSILGEFVYTTTIDNVITAWNNDDGKRVWSYKSLTDNAGILGGGNPAVAQGSVFVGFSSGEVTALRASNGQVRWHDNLAAGVQTDAVANFAEVSAPILIDGNIAYAIANSNRFAAINIRTGGRIWTRKIGAIQMPWLAGNYLYVATNNAKLLALSAEDGKAQWVYQLPIWNDAKEKREPFVWLGPILAGGQLIITNQYGLVKIFNPNNGALIREFNLGKNITIPPLVVNEQILFLCDDGTLIGYK